MCSAGDVPDKSTETLLDAYCDVWVKVHGAFRVLCMDGEMGLNNETAIPTAPLFLISVFQAVIM